MCIVTFSNPQVIPVAMDVRDPEAVKKAADVCVEKCGSLPHMVVNNAAGNFISPTERLSSNAFRTVVDIVLNGTANVTLEFGKRLIEANQGGRPSMTMHRALCLECRVSCVRVPPEAAHFS